MNLDHTEEYFPIGTRVETRGAFEWPNGTIGTVELIPGAIQALASGESLVGGLALVETNWGTPTVLQYVHFDTATDDGSGDGPYAGGMIDVSSLVPLHEDEAGT